MVTEPDAEPRICDNCASAGLECVPPDPSTRATSCKNCSFRKISCKYNGLPASKNRPKKRRDEATKGEGGDEEDGKYDARRSKRKGDQPSTEGIKVEYAAANELENRYIWTTHGLGKVFSNTGRSAQCMLELAKMFDSFREKMTTELREETLKQTLLRVPPSRQVQRPTLGSDEAKGSSSHRLLSEPRYLNHHPGSNEELDDGSQGEAGNDSEPSSSSENDDGASAKSQSPARAAEREEYHSEPPPGSPSDEDQESNEADEEDEESESDEEDEEGESDEEDEEDEEDREKEQQDDEVQEEVQQVQQQEEEQDGEDDSSSESSSSESSE